MQQRWLVMQALRESGIPDSSDTRLQEFVEFIDQHGNDCWESLAAGVREKFGDCLDKILPIIASIDSPLIRSGLIRSLNPMSAQEKEILEKIAREVDPEKDPVSVKYLTKHGVDEVNKILAARPLPEHLQTYLKEGVEKAREHSK